MVTMFEKKVFLVHSKRESLHRVLANDLARKLKAAGLTMYEYDDWNWLETIVEEGEWTSSAGLDPALAEAYAAKPMLESGLRQMNTRALAALLHMFKYARESDAEILRRFVKEPVRVTSDGQRMLAVDEGVRAAAILADLEGRSAEAVLEELLHQSDTPKMVATQLALLSRHLVKAEREARYLFMNTLKTMLGDIKQKRSVRLACPRAIGAIGADAAEPLTDCSAVSPLC
jgi:hypothetical protein